LRITPAGYSRLTTPRGRGIVLESCKQALQQILANETIYDFAARHPYARKLKGRAPVYAVTLDSCGEVVVRRSMRGGALARLDTDLFLPPTRGFRELLTSLHLRALGVATPEVIAFFSYPASGIFRRGDVVTRFVNGEDLGEVLAKKDNAERRVSALESAGDLVASLSRIGAHHPDLNIKNILVTGGHAPGDAMRAWVLDIDRIRFHVPQDPMVVRANADRLERSLRKQRQLNQITISDDEIAAVRARSMEQPK
jgi:3-deoxy-D-manno-octulosonic acid kinase